MAAPGAAAAGVTSTRRPRYTAAMKKTAAVALIALSLLLAGCGNKGSLVKPGQALAAMTADAG